ncbi:GTP pyrophosphokinase family protein [Domibacillus indicus]|uniref:GTP pyrophosphokinase n=1 Tax=Domibacillus indicus TaxID=1437523 RepID=UPI00203B9600|nr:GTP pyrophosphokinase family protein [Domibacillus indicus]MCM3787816.1 GTP pyrophosphokinase family protein [Domibacillus indicus]
MEQEMDEWKKLMLIHKFALDKVNTKLNILNEEFQHIHQYNPIEHIKSRLKNQHGIIQKLNRKGYALTPENARRHVHDIAGIRITCSFAADIYQVLQMLKQQRDIQLAHVKDYIKQPKPNGYQSLHAIIEIPVFMAASTEKTMVEVQIRTAAMDFWAGLEHKLFYKFDGVIPPRLQRELKSAADTMTELDQKMEVIKQEMDFVKNGGTFI